MKQALISLSQKALLVSSVNVCFFCNPIFTHDCCFPFPSHAGGSSKVGPACSRGRLCTVQEGAGSLCRSEAWATLSAGLEDEHWPCGAAPLQSLLLQGTSLTDNHMNISNVFWSFVVNSVRHVVLLHNRTHSLNTRAALAVQIPPGLFVLFNHLNPNQFQGKSFYSHHIFLSVALFFYCNI